MARQSNTELDPLISQYEHESYRPRAADALFALRKIGSIVKPIMRQRMWRVGTLGEMSPSQAHLLGCNWNRGEKIELRLRYSSDPNQFLPLEQVVDTMLHELCHNEFGEHDANFHALWDQLRDEHESLVSKGYTGEGFLGRGQHLGGRRLPLHEATRLARQAAKQAAEQRRQREKILAGGGQKLGGRGILRSQDPRKIIADAAEKRKRIEQGCASGTAAGDRIASGKKPGVTTTKAGLEDEDEATMMQAYIDLIQEEEREKFGGDYRAPSAANPAGPRGSKAKSLLNQQHNIEAQISTNKNNSVNRSTTTSTPNLSPRPPQIPQATKPTAKSAADVLDTWTCEVCTLVNPISYLTCDACTVERPSWISELQEDSFSSNPTLASRATARAGAARKETPNAIKPRQSAYESISKFEAERANKVSRAPVGWTCGGCGNFMEHEWWICAGCGRMKQSS